eukprot:gene27645-7284_t
MASTDLTQTTRYLQPTVQSQPYITTKGHFYTEPKAQNGKVYSNLEKTFFRGRPAGTYRHSKAAASTESSILATGSPQDIKTRTMPSALYSTSGGAFVVELPHSTITYPQQRMGGGGGGKLGGWKTEYQAKYIPKRKTSW